MKLRLLTLIREIFRLLPFWFVLAVISFSLFYQCANIVPPTGGLKDTIPPKILSSKPQLYSTEISPSSINITFDEFIELKNLQQQFIISPPQEKPPEIKQRGKILSIEFQSELAPNTTYTLNFGNSVADLNEGNPLNNFEFVFSTGPSIDSLTIIGRVISAFEKKPEENITVLLYPNHYDSVPMKEIPLYVARTDKEGFFRLRHLRADTFKLFALKDINNNYLYDRPGNEAIAFLDSLIYPTGAEVIKTQKKDTLQHEDPDSLAKPQQEILLRLFTEDVSMQYISSATRPEKHRLFFTLKKPSQKTSIISPLNFGAEKLWSIFETSPGNDSVNIWITDSLINRMDSISLSINFFDFRPDTILTYYDTVHFAFAEVTGRTSQRQSETLSKTEQILTLNVRTGEILELDKKIIFIARKPVSSIDTAKISLQEVIDTIVQPVNFKIKKNPQYPRQFYLEASLQENREYKLVSFPGAFTDIYNNTSDTINVVFKTQKEANYGSLKIDMKEVKEPLIVQLLDDKDKIVLEKYVLENSLIEFKYLKPQKYKLRALVDSNRNKNWDTGNYLLGIQPENAIIYNDPVTIRAAWELELSWSVFSE